MEYAEDDFLMISGIQHFSFLSETMGLNSHRPSLG